MSEFARLEVRGLTADRPDGRRLLHGVDFELASGETVGLVGPSGSGKSVAARAILSLIRQLSLCGEVAVTTGDERIVFDLSRPSHENPFRGRFITYLPQDSVASLFPLASVGTHFRGRPDATRWLARVGFEHPDQILRLYPHELSGGMAQRVHLALALAAGSRFLMVDEPTSALDPSLAIAVAELFRDLVNDGLGLLWITHDLRELFGFASQILVLERGCIIDVGAGRNAPDDAFTHPSAIALVQATYHPRARR